MSEADFYPAGAYNDSSAPYNEPLIPEKEFEVTCSQTLSKTASIYTDDYIPQCDEGCEDGIGYHDEWTDTSETDWKKAYNDVAMTPLDIINACETLAKHLLEQGITHIGHLYMKELIEECQDWNEDDYEVIEE